MIRNFLPTGLMSMASGWMAGKAAVSAVRATTIACYEFARVLFSESISTRQILPATLLRRPHWRACSVAADPDEGTQWFELLPRSILQGNSHHFFNIDDCPSCTHLRLNIYPDVPVLPACGSLAHRNTPMIGTGGGAGLIWPVASRVGKHWPAMTCISGICLT